MVPPANSLQGGPMTFPKCASVLAALALTALTLTTAPVQTANAHIAGKTMTTTSGLQISDSKVGTGGTPSPGEMCGMSSTGWLCENGVKGKKFDSSLDRN